LGLAGDPVAVAVHLRSISGIAIVEWRIPERANFVAAAVIYGRVGDPANLGNRDHRRREDGPQATDGKTGRSGYK
jgi:hypothetical protein